MWPLNVPARDFLRLPGATATPWAVFDAAWYRETYPDDTAHLAGATADAVLAFYFETGQRLGHSPNMLFDERWHRQAYPGIAALVEAGEFPSAFDAWCRGGCCERSPHWLFDELEYRRCNPDLTDELLARNGLVNGYDHYLWRGNTEGRIGHPLFDPEVYRAGLDPAAAEEAAADGPFWHCLRRLHRRGKEVRTSSRFDPDWYARRYPAVAEAIAGGTWRWALEHYLCNATPTEFDPLEAFSEAYYLARYDDAAGMVRRGEIRNGFAHFLRHGVAELRKPSEPLDLAQYAAREDVKRDLEQGLAPDAFVHWLTISLTAGLPSAVPDAPITEAGVTEAAAKTLFRRRARTMAVLHARTKLDFTTAGTPALSVLMVLHDQFDLTMQALGSLRANYLGDIELVLIDSGSTDETRDIQRYVHGATHFRFDTNIGFLLGCNAALQFATADVVLYLNNDTELAPGAVAAAMRRLASDPAIGAVGAMIIRSHGLVQEAGNIIYRDGSTRGYGRDASPLAPEVNFMRDVEFCSGAFLMARRSLLNELEGFDDAFAPAYYEDSDLCLRMRAAGYRVVYDPAVMVHHLEYGSAPSSRASEAEIARARQIFAAKHADYVASRPLRDERRLVFDRMADNTHRRVLFVEDTVPLRMIGSGFVRSNDIVREMASLGYAVTIYPINGNRFDVAGVYADMPDGVEVMHESSLEQFQDFLAQRIDYYDTIWVARTHNLATVRTALERTALERVVTEQAMPGHAVPGRAALVQVWPEQVPIEHAAIQHARLVQAAIERAAPEQSALGQAVSEQIASEQMASEQAASERVVTEWATPEPDSLGQIPPEQAMLEGGMLDQAMPRPAELGQIPPEELALEWGALEQATPLQGAHDQPVVGSATRTAFAPRPGTLVPDSPEQVPSEAVAPRLPAGELDRDVPELGVPELDVPELEVPEPDVAEPAVLEPDVAEPAVLGPGVPEQDVPEQDVPGQDKTARDGPEQRDARPGQPLAKGGIGDHQRLPRVVLDTEAIASLRDAGQAALEGRAFDLDAAVRAELRDGSFCAKIVAINEPEAAMLRDLGFRDVTVLGHMRVPQPTPRPFERRAGMLFVGAMHRMDSPNYDSLCWFVDAVLPLIARELTWETRLTVVGYTGAEVSLERFRDHPRITLRGAVSDLTPLYDSHRVFVAPTRYAAGVPYKVHEAASFGLPVVATELLRRQLGWESGRELLAAEATDPAAFARHVVAVQRDEALWRGLRDAALDRLRQDNDPADYAATIRRVLGAPLIGG